MYKFICKDQNLIKYQINLRFYSPEKCWQNVKCLLENFGLKIMENLWDDIQLITNICG